MKFTIFGSWFPTLPEAEGGSALALAFEQFPPMQCTIHGHNGEVRSFAADTSYREDIIVPDGSALVRVSPGEMVLEWGPATSRSRSSANEAAAFASLKLHGFRRANAESAA